MENKKLVKILQRDMSELEELISDVKAQGTFNPLEMDFIHTRTKGLMQLVRLLKVDDENGNGELPLETETLEEIKETVAEIQDEVEEEIEVKPEEVEVKEKVQEPQKEKTIENVAETPAEETHESDNKKEVTEREQEEPETQDLKSEESEENDSEMLEEEEKKSDAKSTLGDSFLKGKSVNDLVTDQNKLEFKLSNRPVSSIKTAIGINDRFQYIRELFDGDSEKFAGTVHELDSKQNIKEAVDYLRQNFRWKKTETSLKFVNLVKRRFQDE